MAPHPHSLEDLSGKIYIVTGGNAGIGYHAALHLAEHHAKVYLCSRSPTKGNAAIESIKKLYPYANVHLLEIDHLSLASVVSAASQFLSQETQLHGLLNNAGIMAVPFAITPDGHESEWQTNYLAHWVLVKHLLPTMLATSKTSPPGGVRIINMTSFGHFQAPKGGINFADLTNENGAAWSRYGQSKLANVLHAKTLHKEYGPDSNFAKNGEGEIWTAAVHPGFVKRYDLGNSAYWFVVTEQNHSSSQLAGKAGDNFANIEKLVLLLRQYYDTNEGSYAPLFALASKGFKRELSGLYLQRDVKPTAIWESAYAKDMKLAEKLEEWTQEEMTKEGWVKDA